VIPGTAVALGDQKLREASADLLVKREQYGREVTTALIAQVAIIASFLGAFGLLNDAGKTAVVESKWAVWALVAVAVSLCCSFSSYFLIRAKMPSLDQPAALKDFWDARVTARKLWLIAALIALLVAIGLATAAFADARDVVTATPGAAISAKFTAAKDTASSLEATATWSGLDPGEYTLLCVYGPRRAVLAAEVGAAANDGKHSPTLAVPIPLTTKGVVSITTVRLASAPDKAEAPATICTSGTPSRTGQPTTGSVRVG
jgi:hypothetical protein